MTCSACASERESRLRAEWERDEARTASEKSRFLAADYVEQLDAAQKRIEGLETALENRDRVLRWVKAFIVDEPSRARRGRADELLDRIAALSSPAVTAEGKKLGEEGGGP